MTYKKKNEKIERDPVLVLLLSALIIFYALLGILMTFLIVTSHDPFALKIIIEVIWLAGYIGFGVAFYSAYKTTQKILGLEYA